MCGAIRQRWTERRRCGLKRLRRCHGRRVRVSGSRNDLKLHSRGTALGAGLDSLIDSTHGNSANSMQGTEVYYLINNDTGAIDKIGITSYGEDRYPQSFYDAENVTYVPQAQHTWRYAAMVDENIRLTFYVVENGQLPRLNLVTR